MGMPPTIERDLILQVIIEKKLEKKCKHSCMLSCTRTQLDMFHYKGVLMDK
jgi:hypothetical protein